MQNTASLAASRDRRSDETERRPSLLHSLVESAKNWFSHDATSQAAALSFSTLFALAPTLVLAIALAGYFFDEALVRQRVAHEFQFFLGGEAATIVNMVLERAARPGGGGWLAGVVGGIAFAVGASSFFAQLQASLNAIWEVKPKEGLPGILALLKKRLLSFGLVIATGFLLLISLVLSAGLHAVGEMAQRLWNVDEWILSASDLVASTFLVLVIFALIFKVLPDVHLTWRQVAMGSLVTAGLFILGRSLISTYLGNNGLASTYGAASSLVLFLLWVYYSMLILLFGAELTRVYSRRHRDAPAPPIEGAKPDPEPQPPGTARPQAPRD